MKLNYKHLMLLIGLVFFSHALVASAQDLETTDPGATVFKGFVKGRIVEELNKEEQDAYGQGLIKQELKVKILDGSEAGKDVTVTFYSEKLKGSDKTVKAQETVVLAQAQNGNIANFEIVDKYRLNFVYWFIGAFILVALLAARGKGFTALVALAVSMLIVLRFLVPQILNGENPLIITLFAAVGIALINFFVGHGISKRTTVAFVSTVVVSLIGIGLAYWFTGVSQLFGMASEETQFVQNFFQGTINLKGLLLAGIVIAMLGVLDDVTSAQAGAVEELKLANPDLSVKELFKRAYRVGQEHIVGLVNTLFLAYAGVSLPLFLLFSVNTKQPIWVLLNSEFVTEEIVRALVGSITLILAVPLTTLIASWYFGRKTSGSSEDMVKEGVVVEESTEASLEISK